MYAGTVVSIMSVKDWLIDWLVFNVNFSKISAWTIFFINLDTFTTLLSVKDIGGKS
jgi:hypothetical protein